MPARLAALGALAAMDPIALYLQAAAALDVVIHVTRGNGRRLVSEIGIVELGGDGRLTVIPALQRRDGASVQRAAWSTLQERLNPGTGR